MFRYDFWKFYVFSNKHFLDFLHLDSFIFLNCWSWLMRHPTSQLCRHNLSISRSDPKVERCHRLGNFKSGCLTQRDGILPKNCHAAGVEASYLFLLGVVSEDLWGSFSCCGKSCGHWCKKVGCYLHLCPCEGQRTQRYFIGPRRTRSFLGSFRVCLCDFFLPQFCLYGGNHVWDL